MRRECKANSGLENYALANSLTTADDPLETISGELSCGMTCPMNKSTISGSRPPAAASLRRMAAASAKEWRVL